MDFPGHLMYSKEHEWVLVDKDGTASIGITEFAVEQLLYFWNYLRLVKSLIMALLLEQ